MKITKRKDGRYQGSILPPNSKRKYIYNKDKQECKRLLNELEDELEACDFSNVSKLTCGTYFDRWLLVDCKTLSPTTKEAYERYIRVHVKPKFENKIFSKILPMDIQELLNDFSDTHSPKSCVNLRGILHKAFRDGKKNNLIKYNPCEDITMPETEDYELKIYTEKQFNKLLDYVRGTIQEVPIILAGLCGLRRGEIMGLSWNDINFKTHEIKIRRNAVSIGKEVIIKVPKSKSGKREFKAPDYVIHVLSKYKSIGYVYPDESGNPTNGKYYTNKFRKMLKRAELPHTRFHDLRHFNATLMLKGHIPDKVAASRLGHSDVNMTKKYQHVLGTMDDEAVDILNNVVTYVK